MQSSFAQQSNLDRLIVTYLRIFVLLQTLHRLNAVAEVVCQVVRLHCQLPFGKVLLVLKMGLSKLGHSVRVDSIDDLADLKLT